MIQNNTTSMTTAIILAAGQGTRMKSRHPKAMQLLGGQPLLSHLLGQASQVFDRIVVVCAPGMTDVAELAAPYPVVIQQTPQGTADAALAAEAYFNDGDVAILYADTPLITADTLQNLLNWRQQRQAGLVLLSMRPKYPGSYGRVILDGEKVEKIVEWQDATPQERAVELCNAGGLCGHGQDLLTWLKEIDNNNAKGEYYLTDLIAISRAHGQDVYALEAPESELMGINSRLDLAIAETHLQHHLRQQALQNGVTLVAPQSVFLSADTHIEADVIIEPDVTIGPNVEIRSGARIRSFSYLEGCTIGQDAQIGPFARIRPYSEIGQKSRVGNFVEVKNARLKDGVKASHLSYLGDVECGEDCNIGAGTVVCNYDGEHKHHSTIEKDVFVGSNSVIVSPTHIGHDAFIAAGSTITDDIPPCTLAFGRARQVNKTDKYDTTKK